MTKAFIDIVGRDFTGPAFGTANSSITGTIARVGALASSFAALGATVGAGAAFNQFTAFNRSMSEVSTLTAGTSISLDKLTAASKRMAIQFGSQPVEQTKAFYQIISAGAQTTAQAVDTLTAANKLAVAGVTDVATAADGLTSILNAYGDGVKSAADVSDILFVGMRSGKTTIGELSAGLGKVTPIAASLGVGFDELVASIAALTKGGISTSESITGIRAVLAAVAKPTKEAADEAERLGIQFNSTGLASKGFAKFLVEVQSKTGGSTDSLAKLFGGVEALVPVMAFAGQAGDDFNVVLQEMTKRAGLTQEGFELMAASPGFKVDQLMAAISTAGISLGAVLSDVLLPAINGVTAAFSSLFTSAADLSPLEKQISLISDLKQQLASLENRKNIPLIGDLIFDKRAADELKSRIEFAIEDLAKLGPEFESIKKISKDIIPAAGIQSIKTATKEVNNFSDSLKKEARALEIATDPLRKRNDELSRLVKLLQVGGLDRDIFDIKATESINNYEKSIASISDSIDVVESDTKRLADTSKSVFVEMDQYAIGAARNIQSAFANFLFDPFGGGLQGMFKSFANILKRMVAELASSGILRGFASLVGGGTFLGGASSAFGSSAGLSLFGGGGASAVGGGASLTSSIAGLIPTAIKTGVEAALERSLFSHFATSATGESLGLSTANASGSVIAGNISAGSVASGEAASAAAVTTELGASIGSGLASAGISIASSIIASMITNKELFGQSAGTIVGGASALGGLAAGMTLGSSAGPIGAAVGAVVGLVAALGFGHGPEKQRETKFTGSLSAQGLQDGEFDTRFRRTGGFFVSNKNRHDIQAASDEVNAQFQRTMAGIASSVGVLSDNLGLETNRILEFSKPFSVTSANGAPVSAEQINDLLKPIASEISQFLLPEVQALRRGDEDAFQALSRLSFEFSSLTEAATIFGLTLAESRDAVLNSSFAERERFIQVAGGIDALNSKAAFFADNFLTDAERLEIGTQKLDKVLTSLNVSTDISKDGFKDLVQELGKAGGKSLELANSLLDVAPLFLNVRDATKSLIQVVGGGVDGAFSELQKSVDTERNRLTNEYNDSIKGVAESINLLSSLSSALKSTVETINPIGLTGARNTISEAIKQASIGNIVDLASVRSSLVALSGNDTNAFGSRVDFLRSQAKNVSLLTDLGTLTDSQLSIEEKNLSALESGFNSEITRLDSIMSDAQKQVDLLAGIDNTLLTVAAALANFNNAVREANPPPVSRAGVLGGVSLGGTSNGNFVGPSSISDQNIRDTFASGISLQKIASLAIANNVSSARIAQVQGFSTSQVDKFFADNKDIARFEGGGTVPKTGLAIIHKDEQILTKGESSEIVGLLKVLIAEIKAGNGLSKKSVDVLERVTQGNDYLITAAA